MITIYYRNGHWYVECLGSRYITPNRVNAFKFFRELRCPA